MSKEKRASTSVDTFPGMILRISLPNCTSRLSRVASTCSSMFFPCFLPYSTAASMSLAYSSFFDAARIKEGFVVASWGWYLEMVAKSPESQTTVYTSRKRSVTQCLRKSPHGESTTIAGYNIRCQWPSIGQESSTLWYEVCVAVCIGKLVAKSSDRVCRVRDCWRWGARRAAMRYLGVSSGGPLAATEL